jgi:hypothetical protein
MWILQLISILLFAIAPNSANVQFDFLDGLKEKELELLDNSVSGGLSNEKIISSLKEALEVGTENTIQLTGNMNGYLKMRPLRSCFLESCRKWTKHYAW